MFSKLSFRDMNFNLKYILKNYQMKLLNKIQIIFIGFSCNVNDTIMGINNFDKHQYLQGIKCSCIFHDYLANLNCSSSTLTA